MKSMKTITKMNVAYSIVIGSLFSFVFWQQPPDSIGELTRICVFLAAAYFAFRYNNQIKQDKRDKK